MVISLLIITLGFLWLGYETKWLTIRLPIGETSCNDSGHLASNDDTLQSKSSGIDKAIDTIPLDIPKQSLILALPLPSANPFKFNPSSFESLEMPELNGNIQIICVKE